MSGPGGRILTFPLFSWTRQRYLEGDAVCICYVSTSKMSVEARPSFCFKQNSENVHRLNEHTVTFCSESFSREDTQNEHTNKVQSIVWTIGGFSSGELFAYFHELRVLVGDLIVSCVKFSSADLRLPSVHSYSFLILLQFSLNKPWSDCVVCVGERIWLKILQHFTGGWSRLQTLVHSTPSDGVQYIYAPFSCWMY